jgi:hypothetical protein
LQPEHGTYRKDSDTNLVSLIDGSSKFGERRDESTTTTSQPQESPIAAAASVEPSVPAAPTDASPSNENEEHIELGRQEVIRIPGECPNCGHPGETLTALTDIPHFKEVIIMAFTCSQCGYKNSEVRGGGAVPTLGTEVTLRATSAEDLKRLHLSLSL